jgi:hypothetical protein
MKRVVIVVVLTAGTGLLVIGIFCATAFAGPACDAVRRDQTNTRGWTTMLCDDTSDPDLVTGIVDMGGDLTKRTQWYFQGHKGMVVVSTSALMFVHRPTMH